MAADGRGAPALGEFGCLLRGAQVRTGQTFEVRSPFDRSVVAIVHRAGPAEIEQAIAGAHEAADAETRAALLETRRGARSRSATRSAARHEELARTIALEAGKPIKTARAEVDRAAFTFKIAAEETKRIYGEIVPARLAAGSGRPRGARPPRAARDRSPASRRSISRSIWSRTKWRPRSPPAIP